MIHISEFIGVPKRKLPLKTTISTVTSKDLPAGMLSGVMVRMAVISGVAAEIGTEMIVSVINSIIKEMYFIFSPEYFQKKVE